MAKVVIRQGDDWLNVTVDGVNVIDGHRAAPFMWAEVLQKCGVDVVQEDGGFCSWCTKWTTEPLVKANGGYDKVCPKCKEAEDE
jgi:hypothetical protein